jgi:hypothetical protein
MNCEAKMKKIFLAAFLMFFFLTHSQSTFAFEVQGGATFKRIPAGTKLTLRAIEPVSTQSAQAGNSFSSVLEDNFERDGLIILPQGTLIRGGVQNIVPSKRLSRSALLYLNFDHIVTPSGRQLPVKAGICSNFKITNDGAITMGGGYGWALQKTLENSVNIVKSATQWGLSSGEKLFTGGQYILTPVSAAAGTVAAGGYLLVNPIVSLFRRGDEIIVNQGQTFDILLLEPLDVPVH